MTGYFSTSCEPNKSSSPLLFTTLNPRQMNQRVKLWMCEVTGAAPDPYFESCERWAVINLISIYRHGSLRIQGHILDLFYPVCVFPPRSDITASPTGSSTWASNGNLLAAAVDMPSADAPSFPICLLSEAARWQLHTWGEPSALPGHTHAHTLSIHVCYCDGISCTKQIKTDHAVKFYNKTKKPPSFLNCFPSLLQKWPQKSCTSAQKKTPHCLKTEPKKTKVPSWWIFRFKQLSCVRFF